MSAFGAKMPSAVEAEGKGKQPEPAKTDLPTPESTPGPDTERLEADKARRQAEAVKASSNEASPKKKPEQAVTKASSNEVSLKKRPEQAVTKASKAKSGKKKPLETAPSSSSKTSTDQQEEFAPNAEGDEDSDDGESSMSIVGSEPPTPQNFHLQIYEKAQPFLGKLMEDPQDGGAKSELQNLNKQILEQNLKDNLPKEDLENFCIQIDTFIANFSLAKEPHEVLAKDPANKKARETLNKINQMLTQLNERHGYPKEWTIVVPPEPGVDGTESAGSKPEEKTNKSSTKGGVKTKIAVPIHDESDGRTSLGQVVYVKKAGHGSRVIVNRGTEEHPYFEIHPGATFGKGVARDWLKDQNYQSKDLPKDTKYKKMKVIGRLEVERKTEKRITETGRTNRQIQYYVIRVGKEEYVSTRSALLGMKGLSPAILKRIDAKVDRESKDLLVELDEFRENDEHPDTGEPLTSAEIEEMPWLSSDAIPETQENESDSEEEDEDDDIGNIVPKRAGLKRTSKRKAASVSSKTAEDSGNSTETEL